MGGLIMQLGAALLFIFFIVTIVFSAKRWRAMHLVLMVFIFLTSLCFVFLAASVLKVHLIHKTEAYKLQEELTQALKTQEELELGILTEVIQSTDSVRSLESELRDIIIDRGRVWRDCKATAAQGNFLTIAIPQRTVATPAPAPAPIEPAEEGAEPAAATPAPAPAQVASHRMEVKTTIYAFKELPNSQGNPVPAYYLGKYSVTAVTPNSVTITPILAPDPGQVAQIKSGAGSWSLYEVLPIDANHKYSHLDDTAIRALFPLESMQVPPEVHQQMLDQFLRDGKTAQEDDPPERTWITVEFVQKHSVAVDVGGEGATELTPQNFDASGRALANILRQGGDTEFDVGDTATFDSAMAEQLIAQSIAKRGETTYVRELRDYDFHSTTISQRIESLTADIRLVESDTQSVNSSIAKAQKHIAYREAERAKLAADLEKFQAELAAIRKYRDELAATNQSVQDNIRNLFASNLRLAAQLAEIEQQQTNEINERTVQAGLGEQASAAP